MTIHRLLLWTMTEDMAVARRQDAARDAGRHEEVIHLDGVREGLSRARLMMLAAVKEATESCPECEHEDSDGCTCDFCANVNEA